VRKLGVDGASYYLRANLLEFSGSVTEVAHFSGANESEIERPEEQDGVLAYNVVHG
jgi:hypothetical protein